MTLHRGGVATLCTVGVCGGCEGVLTLLDPLATGQLSLAVRPGGDKVIRGPPGAATEDDAPVTSLAATARACTELGSAESAPCPVMP